MNYFVKKKEKDLKKKRYKYLYFFIKKDNKLEIKENLLGGSNNLPSFSSNPVLNATEDSIYEYNITILEY